MSYDVFVSYSTKDKEVAYAACKALENDGIRCWIAPRDVQPGMEYAQAIIEALNTCKVFLIILSEESNTSPQVRREVERAVSKDLSILTFRIDNAILSKAMEYYLSNRHWLDASNAVLSKQLRSLSEAVRGILAHTPPPGEVTGIPLPAEEQESREPAPQPIEAPALAVAPSIPAKTSRMRTLAWPGGISLALALAALAYFGLAKSGLPALSRPTATNMPRSTNMPRPTPTRDYPATAQARSVASTAEAQQAWIEGFAEPIVLLVGRSLPDFQDDFSEPEGRFVRWSYITGGVTFTDGVMHMNTAGAEWVGAGGSLNADDFVLVFEFTPRRYSQQTGVIVNFRYEDSGWYNFGFEPNNDWWGMGYFPGGEWQLVTEGESEEAVQDRTTRVMVIAKGEEFAFYANGHPLTYVRHSSLKEGTVDIGVFSPDGVAEVDLDNVRFWNLANLLP